MKRYRSTMRSPIGEILLVGEIAGDAVALRGAFFADAPHAARAAEVDAIDDGAPLAPVIEELEAYFDGERTRFSIALAPQGTPFQLAVWRALEAIPYGATTTYAAIARAIGRPSASRAVGAANGHNPISIIVPCHRVVGSSGALSGYAGGLERKRALLALEERRAA